MEEKIGTKKKARKKRLELQKEILALESRDKCAKCGVPLDEEH